MQDALGGKRDQHQGLATTNAPELGMSLKAHTRSTPFLSSFEGSCWDLSQSSTPNIHFLEN